MKEKTLELSIPFESEQMEKKEVEITEKMIMVEEEKNIIESPFCEEKKLKEEKQPMVPIKSRKNHLKYGPDYYDSIFNASHAPIEPKRRPHFIKDFTKPMPKNVQTAAGQFGLPAFATYADNCDFEYIDDMPRELRMNSIVVGESGDGKKSVKALFNAILKLIKEDDGNSWDIDRKYRKKKEAAGEKSTVERPEALIRVLKTDITEPELNRLGDMSDGKPFFLHATEPDELDQLRGGPRGRRHFKILKKADDEDNDSGQMRAGTKSVSSNYNLRLNYVVELRPTQLISFYNGEIINGARDRASFCEIPVQPIGAPIPKYGDMGENYQTLIRPYIDNIRAAKGNISCPQAYKLICQLKREIDEYTGSQTLDEVLDKMSHRALCRAFKRACLCYIAAGKKWDPALGEWIRWSFLYDLWLQYHYFAYAVRNDKGKLCVTQRGPVSFRNMLPKEFTFEQFKDLYIKVGYGDDEKKMHGLLRTWILRGIVERTEIGYRQLN